MKLARNLSITTAFVSLSMFVVGVNSAQAISNFSGVYALGNWNTINANSIGSVDITGAPTQVTINTGDNGSATNGTTDFTITAQSNLAVSFSWSYSTTDLDATYEPFFFLQNGTTQDIFNQPQTSGSGTFSTIVSAGNTFGFRIEPSNPGFSVSTSAIISNFDAAVVPWEIPGGAIIPVLGSVFSLGIIKKLRKS